MSMSNAINALIKIMEEVAFCFQQDQIVMYRAIFTLEDVSVNNAFHDISAIADTAFFADRITSLMPTPL